MSYQVAEDRGCISPKGRCYKPGELVDASDFSPDQLARVVRGGYVVEVKDEPKPKKSKARKGRTGRTTPSKWVLDPDGLRGRGLERLNVMIYEIDPGAGPAATAEEAIHWLSQDYVEPKA